MSKNIKYQIPQENIKQYLSMDNQKFQEIKRSLNIATIEPFSYNQLTSLLSFLQHIGISSIKIDDIDLSKFEVDENTLEESIKDIPVPKKIKLYKEKKTKSKKINDTPPLELIPRKINKNKGRVKRIFTPQEDKKILEYYNSDFYRKQQNKNIKNPFTMKSLCIYLKATDRKMIARRASELGFTNFTLPGAAIIYSEKEMEILKENIGKYQVSRIQKIFKQNGYQRSIVSLNVQIRRLKLSTRLNGRGDLSLRLLAEAFGCDTHFFSDSEARMKVLNPKRTKKELIFTRENIKFYVMENPYDFNIAKVDNKFLIELLTGEENEQRS